MSDERSQQRRRERQAGGRRISPRKIGLLFALYFCQGLPGGFLAVVLPVILRERGASLTTIGLASFLNLPWMLKLFWAPLVDRWSSPRFGRRKSWIVPAHGGMIATCAALMLVTPEEQLGLVALLFLVLNVFAATQDVGVDGLAVDILRKDELGPGNASQIAGFKLGNLVGGGVLLALLGTIGWHGDFAIMGGCVLAAMLFLLRTDENALGGRAAHEVAAEREVDRGGMLRKLWQALRSQGGWIWLFVLYAKFGETFGGAMVKPMLVDHGISREMIGVLDGVVGSIATIAGGIAAGAVCRAWSWRVALALFSAVQGLQLVGLGVYSTMRVTFEGAMLLNGIENFAGGGVGVAIFALAMGLCRKEVGATQFTAFQVCYMSGAALAYPLAGRVADASSYLTVMGGGGLMALGLALLALLVGRRWDRR